ncbi:hypothetical protein AC578_7330 [Pseudocercospora eumusae]|uniref:Dystroglycan-type cadherin-like domain-containing protein n=1 Tax=Pseudocercospora eumusae TaxID=321146 RepID=A0A139HWV3_9PEZI|nr:hypothetical protein AC578_7330 [Pseudocercospora eumusae]
MPGRALQTLARVSCTSCALFQIAAALPNVAFPFNSQVPTVARVNQPYTFQISASTFASDAASCAYSLAGQPAWLTINSATRTLTGTPGSGDVGSETFDLVAADNSGSVSMQCTLVVSMHPAPQLTGDVSKQLAESANLSSSEPPVVTLVPSTAFNFDFTPDSFIDIIQRKLHYYATLSDHTPLPSWLRFDSEKLTFSGVAPDLSAFPQSWDINLIASDVAGFAGTYASFTIAIGTQQLVFVPEEQEVNITAGDKVNITVLQNELFSNNVNISPAQLKNAEAEIPAWLHFDASTLAIIGTAPVDFSGANISVTATDNQGNMATAIINLTAGNASLFDGQIGTLSAEAGRSFTYHFDDSLFSQNDLELSVSLPASADWLQYNEDTRNLAGDVPTSTQASAIRATLVAKLSNSQESQTQTFTIDVKAISPTTSRASTPTSTSSFPNVPTSTLATEDRSKQGLSGGVIAAIVILAVAGAALVLFAIIWCLRRRRRATSYVSRSPRPSKETISRPIPPPSDSAIEVPIDPYRDVEKGPGASEGVPPTVPPKEDDPPPQITLNFATNSTRPKSRWLKRISRVSQASSLGVGEDAIRQDQNIPEWGHASVALHTPHDSFSVPAELARVSRQSSQGSPTKKRSVSPLKRLSLGLGIHGGGVARHSSRRTTGKHRRARSSFGALSTTREASSMVSLGTCGTSVLGQETRPSDFPQPPQSLHSTSHSVPTLGAMNALSADPKRKSIRLVARSDSIRDERPIDLKRQSFIRNRASTNVQSPLFTHGSRASSNNTRQTGEVSAKNSTAGSARRGRRGKSMLTMYSESSSLEPQRHHLDSPHRDSRRFSQKIRTAFQPNFPRAVTKSTLYDEAGGPSRASRAITDSSGDWTSDSLNSQDWITELSKPRQERTFVLPGEASPTPPPPSAPPTSRQQSRQATPDTEAGAVPNSAAERLKQRALKKQLHERSSSPLSQNVQVIDRSSPSVIRKTQSTRRNRLSEPLSLVSADSMHKGRPRIGNARRPVSVEEVQRLSSMRAEHDAATTAGSERDPCWLTEESDDEDIRGAGLIPPLGGSARKGNSMRSDLSGPAFL